ncbi:hypothetical protein AFE_0533 [Acidithiobacillus ferrooxidans ATCC 23270]|uniref:Uncharacterized protein n=1 Tax=Acidithiobacillus ferrooxidans (strain ATCC 23270 / DSM 14882 / CIP 104768 / NCIMB 8455) TaxID=243159 RepID=B7J552_ACIF2|nr:hypothetical protein AFE_0533 [Acidithiobacillus ferrooxidans ATCC 23270]
MISRPGRRRGDDQARPMLPICETALAFMLKE